MWVHTRKDRNEVLNPLVDVERKETVKVGWRGRVLWRSVQTVVYNARGQAEKRAVVWYEYPRSKFMKWLMNHTPVKHMKNPVVLDEPGRVVIYDANDKEITNEEIMSS